MPESTAIGLTLLAADGVGIALCAYERGGSVAGLATTLGSVTAVAIAQLERAA